MRVDEIECVVRKWQALPIRHVETAGEPLLSKIGPRQRDRRFREIDAGDVRAALREPREIHTSAATDFEHRPTAPATEVHQPQQVVKLFEMIVIEVVKKCAGAGRMGRDLEVVDMLFPIFPHPIDRQHRLTIAIADFRVQIADCRFDRNLK